VFGFLFFIIAVFQLALTVFISVGSGSDPTEVYLRNYSSVAALMVLADFMILYHKFHFKEIGFIYMKSIRQITAFLAFASIVKVAVSTFYFFRYLPTGNIVGTYYLGEMLVWTAMTLFSIVYYRRVRSAPRKKSEVKIENPS